MSGRGIHNVLICRPGERLLIEAVQPADSAGIARGSQTVAFSPFQPASVAGENQSLSGLGDTDWRHLDNTVVLKFP